MPLSRTRDYLSIGEVLEGLKPDFPDISISKIRFLESEGLIDPDRTASGYRKFYEPDVALLRHILTLQRDHFMPLKVIKDRLAAGEGGGHDPLPSVEAEASDPSSSTRALDLSTVQLNREELLKASGLDGDELGGLEEYGILPARDSYDGDDLLIAKAAKGFFAHGLEPRHLRLYRQTTERELSLIEQIVGPTAQRKDPEGVQEAGRTATDLAKLSQTMRDAMLRANVKALF